MKKPFNIHDWQAKQTIKRLTEQGDIDNIMRMNPDANDMTIKGEKRSVVTMIIEMIELLNYF